MSYRRVIPRDLFNEANLMKCLGQLYLLTERYSSVRMELVGPTFNIVQSVSDGSLTMANLIYTIDSKRYHLTRPLNSREPWPLYAQGLGPEEDEIAVFNDDGTLTREFRYLI